MLKIFTDGGSRGNPGPAAIGYVIYRHAEVLYRDKKFIGNQTNNFAEYTALIESLNYCVNNNLNIEDIEYYLDSQLVVNQLNGIYRVKDENIKKLFITVQTLLKTFKQISFSHIPREKNKEADKLVNEALDNCLK